MKNIFKSFKKMFIKFIACFILILPLMNIIFSSFILGLTGLVKKYNFIDVESWLYFFISLLFISAVVLMITFLINKLLSNLGSNLTIYILLAASIYSILFFMLGYNAYGSDLLSDLINGKNLSGSIFEMLIYLYLLALNIFIIVDFGFIYLIDKIKIMMKKTV